MIHKVPLISFRGEIGAGKTTAAQRLVTHHGFVPLSFADALKVEVYNFVAQEPDAGCVQELTSIADPIPLDAWAVVKNLRAENATRPWFVDSNEIKIKFVNFHKAELRPLLQWWGTEYRRGHFGNDYWVKQYELCAVHEIVKGNRVVTDDCRFENEMQMILKLSGIQVFIATLPGQSTEQQMKRDGAVSTGIPGHISEACADERDPRNDYVLRNYQGIEQFMLAVDELVNATT